MAIYKLLLPKMGESVSEATLTKWVKQVGERIEEDDAVVELATDKVDSEVPSPVSGVLKERLFEENQVVQVGDVIALIEVEGPEVEEQEKPTIQQEEKVEPVVEQEIPAEDQDGKIEDTAVIEEAEIPGMDQIQEKPIQVESNHQEIHSGIRFYSPLVRNIAQQEGISQQELDSIPGTGGEGRVTKKDVLNYLQKNKGIEIPKPSQPIIEEVSQPLVQEVKTPAAQVVKTSTGDSEIIEMDRMRRLIADHMVNSVKTSPHVFSVVEADVTNLVNWRNKVKDGYKKSEGENITFTPLFIEAIAKAIKDFPMINVSVDGYNIIRKKNINIGMATALPSGNLIVPVIKNVDQLSLTGISRSVNDLATRSRGNKLKPDDTQGGTFTFTNIGAFGNIFGMPIINQPQAAILAVGTIKKKPAVLETEFGDVIAVRHMMYISMSYDHRVIDGALGGQFIRRVADYLENWDSERVI
ncbi:MULTISPECIES: dihydrolipoamide acetyltransferase family protein [Sphingobacterium]|uniref:Dihydrolipoamide acetyltransferase component of pyruvate dehydrogenase complex n=1 Tax=Sphingobacterium cellulitidis TaxID=1768011 RepID=A0A8H9G5L7_9SPHI|nr:MULTISPECIES: dihydrolipoamide acetyltransferase family protein [Sphingobacterium]MBA8988441.1 2-oxoglutarate dehydrogenase E2 component (dihydrolipoamide succinyltransferase) [Sphingobacterium soli]OYD43318.1 diapophytoene dehydrogenase [Sphingobacterium cellulitidis]OYD47345.1 diapophytoene dehydrogenase [Sphingobacterium cellulitidis]WFB62714.1 dihydrolipoamide acetyltransferase family protein [Sphingobacterium sp. WM]GGE32780.1 dihydrolipoamide acetyltransferase component of pyruvate de